MVVLPKADRKALAIHGALILAPSALVLGYAMILGAILGMSTPFVIHQFFERGAHDYSTIRFAILTAIIGICTLCGASALWRLISIFLQLISGRPFDRHALLKRLRKALLLGLLPLVVTTLLALFILTDSPRSFWTFPLAFYLSGLPLLTIITHSWLLAKGAAAQA